MTYSDRSAPLESDKIVKHMHIFVISPYIIFSNTPFLRKTHE